MLTRQDVLRALAGAALLTGLAVALSLAGDPAAAVQDCRTDTECAEFGGNGDPEPLAAGECDPYAADAFDLEDPYWTEHPECDVEPAGSSAANL